jgi:hypothetical protein
MHRAVYWLNNSRQFRILELTVICLIPVFLFIIPLDWVKEQNSVCLFKLVSGHECIGCGMTRAVLSVIHFRFHDALMFNKLVIIVFPLLFYIWAKTIFTLQKSK